MKLDFELLEVDLKKKQFSLGLSEKQTNAMIGISRATRWRVSVGKPITVAVLCKLVVFIDKGVERYFTRIE